MNSRNDFSDSKTRRHHNHKHRKERDYKEHSINKSSSSISRSRSRNKSKSRSKSKSKSRSPIKSKEIKSDITVRGRGFKSNKSSGGLRGWDDEIEDLYENTSSKHYNNDVRDKDRKSQEKDDKRKKSRHDRSSSNRSSDNNNNDDNDDDRFNKRRKNNPNKFVHSRKDFKDIDDKRLSTSIKSFWKNPQDKSKNKGSDKWTHDKFEKAIRSPSPTNEIFQPRDSPDYNYDTEKDKDQDIA